MSYTYREWTNFRRNLVLTRRGILGGRLREATIQSQSKTGVREYLVPESSHIKMVDIRSCTDGILYIITTQKLIGILTSGSCGTYVEARDVYRRIFRRLLTMGRFSVKCMEWHLYLTLCHLVLALYCHMTRLIPKTPYRVS